METGPTPQNAPRRSPFGNERPKLPKLTREARWNVIRATRAFYGRPLELEDLQKIHAAHPSQRD